MSDPTRHDTALPGHVVDLTGATSPAPGALPHVATSADRDPDPRWLDHPRGPWLLTFTGRRFFPFEPSAEEVDIRDIAHALANVCRFGGHTRDHYSVAQHSVLVSLIVPPELALLGLLHDAAEAYVGDMIAPIKLSRRLGDYDHIEDLVWCAIVEAFHLTAHGVDRATMAMPREVKAADMVALVTEARDVMGVRDIGRAPGWPSDIEPLGTTHIVSVSPRAAEAQFITRWNELTGGDVRVRSVFAR